MLKVAVTGANGFVGKQLCSMLSASPKFKVTQLVRRYEGTNPNIIDIELMSDADLITQLSEHDCLMHLAARAHTKKATKNDFQRDNLELSVRLASVAVNANIKQFIYLSSIKVLGNTTKPDHSFNNNSEPNPTDMYGQSKLQSEIAIRDLLNNSSTALTIVRPPLVWGPECKGNLNTLITLINKGIPLPFAGIENSRDIVSISNLCDFLRHIILHPEAANKPFVVSDEKKRTTKDIIHLLEAYSITKARLIRCPDIFFVLLKLLPRFNTMVSSFYDNLEVDITETKHLLDWTPKN